jgi:Ca-activated chloride channel homolog
MTENELKRLKDLAVPPPAEGAKEAVVAAALAAFERPAIADAGTSPATPQGNAAPPRLRGTSAISEGKARMRFRRPMAIAASIAVLALAVPLTLHLMRTAPPQDQREDKLAALPRPVESQPKDHQAAQPPPPPAKEEPPKGETKVAELPKPKAPPVTTTVPSISLEQVAPPPKVDQVQPPPPSAKAPELPAPPPTTANRADAQGKRSAEARHHKNGPDRARKEAAADERPLQKYMEFSKRQPGQVAQAPKTEAQKYLEQNVIAGGVAVGGLTGAADDGRDRFAAADANRVKSVTVEPVSTFSIDVDTASYAFVRRTLNSGRLPPKDAVRVEEMVNYFPYQYPLPEDRSAPFRPTVTVLPSPWNPANKLIHIAIKGYDVPNAERPRANLVLLIDTSGSMAPEDRLPLLKNAFRMLIDTLRPDDTVGIVTYAGGTHAALEPTKVADRRKVLEAIERLHAGGSTAGGAGIQEAYRMAEAAFDKAAVNRVILATDGDFNVGITDVGQLKSFIERKRETGVYLSVLGVGRGNYNDALMQALAQNGNGIAAYIDTLNEARKVLVDEVSSTLFPIAKDVKIQVEFNPAMVAEYRLIGYETRLLKREDFNNDKIDAGDIGSGHTVTAIYEITPVGSPKFVEDLRYKQPAATTPRAPGEGKGEYGFLRINYKLPAEAVSRRIEFPIAQALEKETVDQASAEVRFSIAVAAFGQLLRGEPYLKSFGYDEVIALAAGARGEDLFGYRAEFLNLVRLAKTARP